MKAAAQQPAALDRYKAKRRFSETPEPRGMLSETQGFRFVVQKHDARRLHFDFRLELDGVLKSWAVTRGPSLDTATKRLAVRTEDHPVDYAHFEGLIPDGHYGAGTVMLWDRGTWEPIGDPRQALDDGKIAFNLYGERMKGRWALVRMKARHRETRENWLLIKERDQFADPARDLVAEFETSVESGRNLDGVARGAPKSKPRALPNLQAKPGKGAEKAAAQITFVPPQLATLTQDIPRGADWLFEVKFDGYRLEALANGSKVRLLTRSGLDWTHRFDPLAKAFKSLKLDNVLMDGEVAVLDADGRPDFGALQNALEGQAATLTYFAFDLLYAAGEDLRPRPLRHRKARLKALLAKPRKNADAAQPVVYVDDVCDGAALYKELTKRGFEGVIAKRGDDGYRSGRTESWLKIKAVADQEFVIIGTSPSHSGRPFASILIAERAGGVLRYAGRVGSGFGDETLAKLSAAFARRARNSCPIDIPPPRDVARTASWIKPDLVARIAFAARTRDGLVRHGSFLGLRADKGPAEVHREDAKPLGEIETTGSGLEMQREPQSHGPASSTKLPGGLKLTHPDKILFPGSRFIKHDLALYYAAVAERLWPYVEGRLVSLVRCPDGTGGTRFFQRHAGPGVSSGRDHHLFTTRPVTDKDGATVHYLGLTKAQALPEAAQSAIIELHIWGSRFRTLEKPDRLVFDLDPDEGLPFARVRDAAFDLRDILEALRLASFAMMTGGKGVHVVVPVVPQRSWPEIKRFCAAIATKMEQADPNRFVASMSKARRKGRIFIDHFRNERGATAVAPYSPRANPDGTIAYPISWNELRDMDKARAVTMTGLGQLLRRPDPWAGYAGAKQRIRAEALAAINGAGS